MQLQNINQVSMTSLEIAELTGKLHKNVMRDIRNMFNELKIEPTVFIEYFEDKNGDKQPLYKLSKEHALCLTSGYSAILRLKIIRKVEELSQALIQPTYTAHNMIIAQNVEQLIQDDQKYKEYASECGRQLQYLKELNAIKKESLQRIIDFAQKELALF
jgi:phage regulator Rha-like protein